MKKYLYIFIVAMLAAACYADKSTMATFDYPDIVITVSSTEDTLSYAYGETLEISASAVQEGVSDDKLSYLWEMDLRPDSNKDRAELGTDKSLEYRVLNSPSSSPYYLTLTVKNTESGFSRTKVWPMYVTNSLGEGILVADTRDNGKTWDLDLVATSSVTYGYSSNTPRVTKGLYSLGNGEPLTSRVTAMVQRNATDLNLTPVSSYNYDVIMVGTENELMALLPENYKKDKSDNALMSAVTLDKFGVRLLANGGTYSSFAIIDGRPFACCDMLDYCYGGTACPDAIKYSFTASNTCIGMGDSVTAMYMYDDATHAFYFVPCWSAFQSSITALSASNVPSASFLADKTCVACGTIKGYKGAFILKGSDGTWWCAVVTQESAAATYQLTATDIDKAEHWAFCDNSDLFYYSVGNAVYSTIITGGSAVTKKLNWTPDTDAEKITMMLQYRQAWFGLHNYDLWAGSSSQYMFPLAYNRLQMVMVTYNESTGEGKFYLRPYNVSTGMFSVFNNNGSVGGFGEISAICTTLR